jgi:predicted MFS family arabinose efflux permease
MPPIPVSSTQKYQNPYATLIVLVVASTIISLSMGMRQSLGLFLPPLNSELGVSATAFGFAMALQNIVWGISQPIVGLLGDRYGARPVLIASALIYAAGLLVMGSSSSAVGLDGGGGVMMGLGIAGTGYGVLIGSVSQAVRPERRNQMVGLVAASGSLATFILAPLGQYVIGAHGWRIAFFVFAGFAILMGLLAIAIGRDPVASDAEATKGTETSIGEALRNAIAHRGFMAMTVAFFACGFQLMFITTHFAQFLSLCGIGSTVSASAIGIIGLSNAVGSYLFGVLGAHYSQKRLLASIYLFRTLSIVLYLAAPITPVSTLLFAAAMGFLWLGVVPLVSGLIRKHFGLRYFNTLFGVAFFSHQVGGFMGSWLGGVSFDMTGSYTVAWMAMIVIGLTATAIQWTMDDRLLPAGGLRSPALAQPSAA